MSNMILIKRPEAHKSCIAQVIIILTNWQKLQ